MWLENMTKNVPTYIVENAVELAGTLLASVIIAVITTYIFNRSQERQKVKARVMHFRLEMYEEIMALLKKYDLQVSYENEAAVIKDALALAGFDVSECSMHTSLILSDWRRLDVFQEELDQICTRGIYILDDAVLRKLLSLKIYVLNCRLLANMLDGYQLENGKQLSKKEIEGIKDLFFQYYSVVAAKPYAKFVADLELEIHKKRTRLRFERAGKDYKKIWRRNRLRSKVFKKSGFKKRFPKALILLELCVRSHLNISKYL